MSTVHEEKAGELTLKIVYDEDPRSPQEWGDDSLFLVADHRNFYVKPPIDSTFESVVEDYKKTHHVFGLEAYIHSGIVLALSHEGRFPDRKWDVSQLGAVFAARKEWKTKEKARAAALWLIKEWNDYLSGNVYGFVIEDERGEVLESVWGFSGDYEESGILADARAAAKHCNSKEEWEKRAAAYKAEDLKKARELAGKYGLNVV